LDVSFDRFWRRNGGGLYTLVMVLMLPAAAVAADCHAHGYVAVLIT
jgi:hypothetical protein